MTDDDYYLAKSADKLQDVFANLPKYYVTTIETQEISVAFTGLGAILTALALALPGAKMESADVNMEGMLCSRCAIVTGALRSSFE